jgi:hypothetical protein
VECLSSKERYRKYSGRQADLLVVGLVLVGCWTSVTEDSGTSVFPT